MATTLEVQVRAAGAGTTIDLHGDIDGGARDRLALDRALARMGGEHQHRPHRVIGLCGELHGCIVACGRASQPQACATQRT